MSCRKIIKTCRRHSQIERFIFEGCACVAFSGSRSYNLQHKKSIQTNERITTSDKALEKETLGDIDGSGSVMSDSIDGHNPQHDARSNVDQNYHLTTQAQLQRQMLTCNSQLCITSNHGPYKLELCMPKRYEPVLPLLPYFVACFSPTKLPTDVFVHFLQFLAPGDLWRLCEVSRDMRTAVLSYMSAPKRIEFEIVRVLRQENWYTPSEWLRVAHVMQFESIMDNYWATFRSRLHLPIPPPPPEPSLEGESLPSPVFGPGYADFPDTQPNRGQVRGQYWEAQSELLMITLTEEMPYGKSPEHHRTLPSAVLPNTGFKTEEETAQGEGPVIEENDIVGGINSQGTNENNHVAAKGLNAAMPLTHIQLIRKAVLDSHLNPPPLPLQRFQSMVNVIFDANLVRLDRRRAIINCARYTAAAIESVFGRTIEGRLPIDPTTLLSVTTATKAATGLRLEMLAPQGGAPAVAVPPETMTMTKETLILPSPKLNNCFKQMLWHGCISNLIRLYNFIQELHTRPSVLNLRTYSDSLLNTSYSALRRYQELEDIFVFSGTAGVSACQSSSSACPSGIEQRMKSREKQLNQRVHEAHDQAFTRKRFMMKERIRRDRLVKEELLSICHMACGLFKIRDFYLPGESSSPLSIVALLRRGSPWGVGAWREGEWRSTPVDLDHDIDEIAMSRRLHLEQEYRFESGLLSHQGLSPNEAQARMSELFSLSPGRHGLEECDDMIDQGPWQRLSLATIQFLAHENLEWAGSGADPELSWLRVTFQDEAWYYHE
ncbi:hypothetical protein BX616_010013 [Lobosporangium transversale]|uniref:F-box domain-containing protein n=1 Tax=Lobosporangium transversale TaxID=64571 RepID=A0A1Y2GUA6_9FUNG|nr:hypothetical protein BCR41DRAFT_394132 [Lobosporangium transversale]KAF9913463.1 hypothetical protein BX616_010013 [Lobosporangium transversale]ORZ23806.1 hypothetical protein BCR41DRAFT_394132 [Lobosporangium transversale]|eukprot:XP_021883620.1 hypothetical protein BCR41DRAFT_394132 [Lobosporangium transversale]